MLLGKEEGMESGFQGGLGPSVFGVIKGLTDHSRLGASVTLETLPSEADQAPGAPDLLAVTGRDAGASSRAGPYCFPLRPVLVLVPIHRSCFLICIFFLHGHAE